MKEESKKQLVEKFMTDFFEIQKLLINSHMKKWSDCYSASLVYSSYHIPDRQEGMCELYQRLREHSESTLKCIEAIVKVL